MKSRCSCLMARFGSHRPSQVLLQASLPFCRTKSISSCVNVAIEIDLTRCGGVIPRLKIIVEREKKKHETELIYSIGEIIRRASHEIAASSGQFQSRTHARINFLWPRLFRVCVFLNWNGCVWYSHDY